MQVNIKTVSLKDLHFDLENPRYGVLADKVKGENQALDLIVSDFVVDDLLSSIAVNGFFTGEPLIAKPRPKDEGDGFVVIEGNRRLAALLILARDSRASGQLKRSEIYSKKMEEHRHKPPREVPVIVVEEDQQERLVLAYLGTKHIVGPSDWDSFAKAKWMSDMRSVSKLSLKRIKEMIGDTSGLVDRMLEGYYVIQEVKDSGKYNPSQSYVKGRGSNPDFPFSWVYTALNLSGVRNFLGLESKGDPEPNCIPPDRIENAADFFTMIFGDRSLQRKPVIKESRELSMLSKALTDVHKCARLREGMQLNIVIDEAKPIDEKLSLLSTEILERLRAANGILSEGKVFYADACELIDKTLQIATAAKNYHLSVKRIKDTKEEELFDGI